MKSAMKATSFHKFFSGDEERTIERNKKEKNLIHGLKALRRLSTMVSFKNGTEKGTLKISRIRCHNQCFKSHGIEMSLFFIKRDVGVLSGLNPRPDQTFQCLFEMIFF